MTGFHLARSSAYSLAGQLVPLLGAAISIPLLVAQLGTERFGILTIAWMVIGYFSLFDLGLGRALTQIISSEVRASTERKAPPMVWTSLAAMGLLGTVGGFAMAAISPWLVQTVLTVPATLESETLWSFVLLALAIPLVVLTAGLVGVLTAFNRFGVLSGIRAPTGTFMFVAPLAVLPFSHSLVPVTAVLVVGRMLSLLAHAAYTIQHLPRWPGWSSIRLAELKPVVRFGAWMTVTNLIGPLMLYLDRVVIGATSSVSDVAHYATPYEMITKMLIVPGAVLSVLFPAFSAEYGVNPERLASLYIRGTKYIALLLFPPTLVVVGFAPELLSWWLDPTFASAGSRVLQILAVGVFVNSLAQVTFTLVQGVGRPDISARLHLFELVMYLPVLWWAIGRFGIVGAAAVWTGRVALDGVLLLLVVRPYLRVSPVPIPRLAVLILGSVGLLALPMGFAGGSVRALIVALTLVLAIPVVWYILLGGDERARVLSVLRR